MQVRALFNLLLLLERTRGRDELNRTLIIENQRLRQTMNLNGCASRVSSHNPCGIHAVKCAERDGDPEAEIVDLLSSTSFARVWRGFDGCAHARAPQKSATFALQIVHRAIRFGTST